MMKKEIQYNKKKKIKLLIKILNHKNQNLNKI